MRLTSLSIAAAFAVAMPASAQPSGLIAYVSRVAGSPYNVHVMNPDGSGRRALAQGQSPSWSPDGERILYHGVGGIRVINRDGTGQQLLLEAEGVANPVFSHDGQRIFFQWSQEGESFIHVMDAAPGAPPRQLPLFPSNPEDATFLGSPAPSPDGRTVAFLLSRPSRYGTRSITHLYLAAADGSNIRLIGGEVGTHDHPAWSPDGSRLAFYSRREDGEGIYVADARGESQVLLSVPWAIDWSPTWSPDGEWIAFASNQSRKSQDIFIMRPDGSQVTNLTRSDEHADHQPAWSPVALPPLPTAVVDTRWGQVKSVIRMGTDAQDRSPGTR